MIYTLSLLFYFFIMLLIWRTSESSNIHFIKFWTSSFKNIAFLAGLFIPILNTIVVLTFIVLLLTPSKWFH